MSVCLDLHNHRNAAEFLSGSSKTDQETESRTPIVFGGSFPTMAPKICLKESYIDIVSLGDGEDKHVELAKAFSKDGNIKSSAQ